MCVHLGMSIYVPIQMPLYTARKQRMAWGYEPLSRNRSSSSGLRPGQRRGRSGSIMPHHWLGGCLRVIHRPQRSLVILHPMCVVPTKRPSPWGPVELGQLTGPCTSYTRSSIITTLSNIDPYPQAALRISTCVSQLFLNQTKKCPTSSIPYEMSIPTLYYASHLVEQCLVVYYQHL